MTTITLRYYFGREDEDKDENDNWKEEYYPFF